jgi:hypothetical protein
MSRVRNGYTKSCGCITKETAPGKTHGMKGAPEYSSWTAMKARCLNPKHKDFERYGGAGISVYEGWVDCFEQFYQHLGPRPAGTSLDRIDNKKGYAPGNVRWATYSQQRRNSSSAKDWFIKGMSFETAQDAATHFGVSKKTVWCWVNGAFDKRRNTFTQPRGDCYAVPRY